MASNGKQSILKIASKYVSMYVEPGMNVIFGVGGVLFGSFVVMDGFIPHYVEQDKKLYNHDGWKFISNVFCVVCMDIGIIQYYLAKGRYETGQVSKSVYDKIQLGTLIGDILYIYSATKYFVFDKRNESKYKMICFGHIALTLPLSLVRIYSILYH